MSRFVCVVFAFFIVLGAYLPAFAQDLYREQIEENAGEETPDLFFKGQPCTQDCSGHEAGYAWAEEHEIESEDDCGGSSNSFIEGCVSWVEEQAQDR